MPDHILAMFPVLALTVPRSEVVGLCATMDALEAYRAYSPECSPEATD